MALDGSTLSGTPPSGSIAFESPGSGGALRWSMRPDGHWHSETTRGHFDLVPMRGGWWRLWWRGKGGYVDLGSHDTPGEGFAAARRYLDEGGVGVAAEASKEVARECGCPGTDPCSHSHPGSVPTTPCAKEERKLEWKRTRKGTWLAADRIAGAPVWYEVGKVRARSQFALLIHVGSARAKPEMIGLFQTIDEAKAKAAVWADTPVSIRGASEASIADAPAAMHIEIQQEAYAQWVAYGDAIGPVDTTEKMARLTTPLFKGDQEVFIVVVTDLHHKLRSVTEVARGERSSVNVGIEEVMRAALMTPGATHFACFHNHPTGKCLPSKDDRQLHASIEKASSSYASLTYLDHVVIGVGEFYSIRESKKGKLT